MSEFGPTPKLFILPATINHQEWLSAWAKNNLPATQPVIPLNEERGEESLLSVELVRELVGNAHLQARKENPTTYLLLHLEKASQGSQNALLKILEEPPAGLHLLLSTSQQTSVLETIISRCQIYPFEQKNFNSVGERGSELPAELPEEMADFPFGFWSKISHSEIVNLVENYLKVSTQKQKDEVSGADDETKSALERRSALHLLQVLMNDYREQLLDGRVKAGAQKLELLRALTHLQTAHLHLHSNVNPKLTLENLFFTLKSAP